MNILHANIDVNGRKLIAGFPRDVVQCIEKLQVQCASMNCSGKSRYELIFEHVTHKGGKSETNYIKRLHN